MYENAETFSETVNFLKPSAISYGYTSIVQHHKGLTYHFLFLRFGHSGAQP